VDREWEKLLATVHREANAHSAISKWKEKAKQRKRMNALLADKIMGGTDKEIATSVHNLSSRYPDQEKIIMRELKAANASLH